jgi:GTP-binding protein Era
LPRSGFVALVGLPNAGKSTLLNRLVGQKLAITSSKPQTTRDRVVGIATVGDTQMVFVDTPGLLKPEYELQERMRASARRALHDADVIVYLADAQRGTPPALETLAGSANSARAHAPTILALTKLDLLSVAERAALAVALPDAVTVSAKSGEGIETLVGRIAAVLPEGPFLFPPDELSTLPLRFFAAELVREVALEQLDDEVPYSVACAIEEFREERSPVYIRATLYVERASQKRILIGAKGARIRDLGSAARLRIEALVGAPVYLDLWVKVAPHWRREPHVLDRLGYKLPE